MTNAELMGELRSVVAYGTVKAKASLIADLRKMKPHQVITPDVVLYVTEQALPKNMYTDKFRGQVKPEDIYALLTFDLKHFFVAIKHHFALFSGWWGIMYAMTYFSGYGFVTDCPVFDAIKSYIEDELRDCGMVYFDYDGAHLTAFFVENGYTYSYDVNSIYRSRAATLKPGVIELCYRLHKMKIQKERITIGKIQDVEP